MLDRPSIQQPTSNCTSTGIKASAPFGQAQGFSVVRNELGVPSVLVLCGAVSPSAVARLIVAVIVDAVNRVIAFGARPHIFKEAAKRLKPSVTHGNATPTVVLIVRLVRVIATIFHACPTFILRHCSPVRSIERSSFLISQNGNLAVVTPARCCVFRSQLGRSNSNAVTTVTLAKPSLSSVFTALTRDARTESENSKTAKSLTRQVKANIIECRHWIKANSFNLVIRAAESVTFRRPASILAQL